MYYKIAKVVCQRNDELKGSIQSVEIFYSDKACNPRCNMGEIPSACIPCIQKLVRLYEREGISAFDKKIDVKKLP